jgi:hypothetical protein
MDELRRAARRNARASRLTIGKGGAAASAAATTARTAFHETARQDGEGSVGDAAHGKTLSL